MGQTAVSNSGLEAKSSLLKIWLPVIEAEGKKEVITFKSKVAVHENFASVNKCSIFFSQYCSIFIYFSLIMFSGHLS